MITHEGIYYLYRHIRLDKNEPFYIGIGTKQCGKEPYSRSKDYLTKNNIWKKIVKKTKYKIEILLESNDDLFIQEKEREFISLYGRICQNNGGILSNIKSGGRTGSTNYLVSKKVYCCNNNTWYNSISEAAIDLSLDRSGISRVLSGEFLDIKGYVFNENECNCNQEYFLDGWFPIVDKKYGYYINKQKEIKKVFVTLDSDGNTINKKERDIKPVVRKGSGNVQMTISHHNKRFNVNLKKEYKNIFGLDWGDTKLTSK